MTHLICDRASHRITHREYTDEGFLRVPGKVARTGIQKYLARELELPGDPNRVVSVYRPADEVFHNDSLVSFDGVDVTVNHPDGLVNSKNYKKVSVGFVRGVGRVEDGEFIVCDLIVKDQAAIDAINSGKCELSAGYTAVWDATPGVTADGEEYELIQRDIRINHVALVDNARAGASARVFDRSKEVAPMTHKVMLDSGRTVVIADEAAALLVGDTIERLTKSLADAEAKAEKAQALADASSEQLVEARQAGSDAAIQARVKAIATVQVKAARIAGASFACDSVDPVEIARAAMVIARPKVGWADKSAAYVQAAFDAKIEEIEEEEEDKDDIKDAGGEGKKRIASDNATLISQLAQLAKDGAGAIAVKDAAPKMSAYEAFKHKQGNAWKKGT